MLGGLLYHIKNRKEDLRHFDFGIFFLMLVLIFIGFLSIYSASEPMDKQSSFLTVKVEKQLISFILGLFLFLFIILIDYRLILKYSFFLYLITLGLLVLVLKIGKGTENSNVRQWFTILGFKFQPSEISKVTFLCFLAYVLSNLNRIKGLFSLILKMFLPIFILLFPLALILKQPDLGTALCLPAIFAIMILIRGLGIDYKIIALLLFITIIASPFVLLKGWDKLKPHQQNRFIVWLYPEYQPKGAGYHLQQSKIAIGSGGLLGKGFLTGSHHRLEFIPECDTDFIMAVIAEDWGFLGIFFVLLFYLLFFRRAIRIALKCNKFEGVLLVSGVVAMIFFQFFENVAMVIGFMPITGIPLPFISYGGSSLISSIAGVALMINVGMRRRDF